MWIEVARLAGKHKAVDLVKRAAAVVRRLTWRLDVNREMIIRQADVDLILAAAITSEVARLPFSDEGTSSLDTSEDHEDEKEDEELHRQEAEVCGPINVLEFAHFPRRHDTKTPWRYQHCYSWNFPEASLTYTH